MGTHVFASLKNMQRSAPPIDETELIERAYEIAGRSIGEICREIGVTPPCDTIHSKGWFGAFMEILLGADAGSNPVQDFSKIGVELKTLPLGQNLQPLETTYVCITPLTGAFGKFEESNVCNKLKRVLWVPFDGRREVAIADRTIFTPFLWSPTDKEMFLIKTDWEEHMEKISSGRIEEVTAKDGKYLQIRPKAANGKSLTEAIGKDGTPILTRPRGFYLKKEFSAEILSLRFAG